MDASGHRDFAYFGINATSAVAEVPGPLLKVREDRSDQIKLWR